MHSGLYAQYYKKSRNIPFHPLRLNTTLSPHIHHATSLYVTLANPACRAILCSVAPNECPGPGLE